MTENQPVAIIGAGTMGWQIALQLAAHGTPVHLYDRDSTVVERALQRIHEQGAVLAAEHLLPPRASELGELVRGLESLDAAVEGCWYVIEAIPERMELKRELFAQMSRITGSETILATNSSSFKSRHLAAVTVHPERLMNSHYYNVPWRRSGLELMTCGVTEFRHIERVAALARRSGLVPVIAEAESTGFVFNRVWHAVKRESLKVIAEGVATPEEVDRLWCLSMEASIGPFAMMDRVGLDVVLDIERHYAEQSGDPNDEPPRFLAEMVERGELGRKTGSGFYRYPSPPWERPGWPRT
jgi:3-hydroxybutyryl-CoA dehydrogenase